MINRNCIGTKQLFSIPVLHLPSKLHEEQKDNLTRFWAKGHSMMPASLVAFAIAWNFRTIAREQQEKETAQMKKVGLFGTCRVSSLTGDGLRLIRRTKHKTTAVPVAVTYQDAHAVYECQPFNYTTKLQDVIDAIRYLQGDLLEGSVSANDDETFYSLFCRGFDKACFERRECREPGSWSSFDLVVAEVSSLRQVIIRTDRFGNRFKGLNLPWNILLEEPHRLMDLHPEDFEIIEPTQPAVDAMLKELVDITGCPLLIIGPYLLPEPPRTRTLYGEDDDIPIDKINSRRREVASLLTNSRHRSLFSYFDMTDHLAAEPGLLSNQYHFDDRGNGIIYRRILQELMATG
jgi:hypothetical protein